PLLVLVETRAVLAEDRVLEGPVRRPERLQAVLLLYVVRDFETSQRLDLPLGRARPDGVAAPDHVIGAQPPDELPHHRRAHPRVGHGALGEDLAEVAVDVLDAVL